MRWYDDDDDDDGVWFGADDDDDDDYGYDGNDKGGFQKFLLQYDFSLLNFSL